MVKRVRNRDLEMRKLAKDRKGLTENGTEVRSRRSFSRRRVGPTGESALFLQHTCTHLMSRVPRPIRDIWEGIQRCRAEKHETQWREKRGNAKSMGDEEIIRTSDSVRSMRSLLSSVRFSEDLFSSSPSSLKTLTSSSLPRSSPPPLLLTCGIIAGTRERRPPSSLSSFSCSLRQSTREIRLRHKAISLTDTGRRGILRFPVECVVRRRRR